MLFQKKFDQAMELLHENNEKAENSDGNKEELENEEMDNMLEKHDKLAMTISAFLVFIPVAIVILAIFALLTLIL